MLLENNKYIAFNGFMTWDSNDNKIRQQTYYWEWPFETGEVDENGIAEGDAEDSKFMGSTMSMNITATGTQVLENTLEGKVAATIINGNLEAHDTVQEAIDTSDNHSGALITLLENQSVDGITIADTENLVLDLNGKTLTIKSPLANSGNLTIEDSSSSKTGKIESITSDVQHVITNTGTLKINSGTISSLANRGILNSDSGQIAVNGANIQTKYQGIRNEGGSSSKIIINSGNISSGSNAISNQNNGQIEILGGQITNSSTSNNPTVYNWADGYIKISGGKISSTYVAIWNVGGTIEVTGGELESTATCIYIEQTGFINISGNAKIKGANGIYSVANASITVSGNPSITGTNSDGIRGNTGTVNVSGGTITGEYYGVKVTSENGTDGSAIVTGGTITGKKIAILADGNSSVILGDVNNTVNTKAPIIIGEGRDDGTGGVSIYLQSTATLNFYSGIIKWLSQRNISRRRKHKSKFET